MAKTNNTPVEFIETTSTKLTTVQSDPKNAGAFIHVKDEKNNDTVDNQLYIGDDRVTDRFNLGDTNLSSPIKKVGGLVNTDTETFNDLKDKSVSEILIMMLTPVSVKSITLNADSHNMKVGGSNGTLTITATVLPDDAADKTVGWFSSNESIATVSNGVVTAHALGSTTIIATAGGKTATWEITVQSTPVTSVSIKPTSSVSMNEPNHTETLSATVQPTTATDQSIVWSSSDSNIVDVDPNTGVITAKGVGSATITATAHNGKKATKIVTVSPKNPPTIDKTLYPYVSISYDENIIAAGIDTLPTENDMNIDINGGVWENTDNVQYTGGNTGISLTIKKDGVEGDYLGQLAEVGVYTINGSTTFLPAEINPTDNFNQVYEGYTGGPADAPETITIVAVHPVSISTGSDISEMIEQPLFNYLDEDGYTLKVDVPEESLDDKFRIRTSETFEFLTNDLKNSGADESLYSTVYQYNKFSEAVNEDDKYDILIDMVFDTDTYLRTLNPTDRKGPSKYKIKFKK